MKKIRFLCLLPLLVLVGCGGSGGTDTDTPVSELKQEAETLSVENLKAKAESYEKAISQKLQDLEPLKEKLAAIPMTEQMGEEAKALQGDIASLTTELNDLKERLAVYVDALKEKGAEFTSSLK